jgi:hypothetical protein
MRCYNVLLCSHDLNYACHAILQRAQFGQSGIGKYKLLYCSGGGRIRNDFAQLRGRLDFRLKGLANTIAIRGDAVLATLELTDQARHFNLEAHNRA